MHGPTFMANPLACAVATAAVGIIETGRWRAQVPRIEQELTTHLSPLIDAPHVTDVRVVGAIGVISVTAMSIFAVLPNFWTLPTQFLTGAPAAAGVALINTIGNIAGFSAGYITGAIHDWTGGYVVPMVVVGGFMILSAVLMVLLARRGRVHTADAS